MSQSLINLVASVLGIQEENLTPASGPMNIAKWDSLTHIAIVAAVEEIYGVQLSMPEILSIRTIQDLRKTVERHGIALSDSQD